MNSPFRDEAAAFRLVLLSLGYFGLIAVASWISGWLGLVVFVALTTAVIVAVVRAKRETAPPPADGASADVEDTPGAVVDQPPTDDDT